MGSYGSLRSTDPIQHGYHVRLIGFNVGSTERMVSTYIWSNPSFRLDCTFSICPRLGYDESLAIWQSGAALGILCDI